MDYSRNATDNSIDFSLTDLASGESIWFVAVFDAKVGYWSNSDDSDALLHVQQNAGTSYGDLGFRIRADGSVNVRASDNGGAAQAAYHSTGATVPNNSRNLVLIRATKGTPSSAPTNSKVDFWLNPVLATSPGALGTPTWTTGTDSGFGKDGNTFTRILARPTHNGGRIDEIRIGKDYYDVMRIEPLGTLILIR